MIAEQILTIQEVNYIYIDMYAYTYIRCFAGSLCDRAADPDYPGGVQDE